MTAHITDIGTTPALFLVAILLMMMGLGVYLFFSMSETRTVMYITNAGLLALCAMFGWFLYGANHSTVTIEGDMLRVNVPIYAAITDKSSVVYLPATEDYAMLLSIEEPDALLEALGRAPVNGS